VFDTIAHCCWHTAAYTYICTHTTLLLSQLLLLLQKQLASRPALEALQQQGIVLPESLSSDHAAAAAKLKDSLAHRDQTDALWRAKPDQLSGGHRRVTLTQLQLCNFNFIVKFHKCMCSTYSCSSLSAFVQVCTANTLYTSLYTSLLSA
jgi:hypothetical protein